MGESMVERIARAIEDAELGYHIKLVGLIDDVASYTLELAGEPLLTFPSHAEALEHVVKRRAEARARAAIEAMREPTAEMIIAGVHTVGAIGVSGVPVYAAMINEAISTGARE